MVDDGKKPELKVVSEDGESTSIPRPEEPKDKFNLDRFKSTRDPTLPNVETLFTGLPHYSISQAKDWVRLHPDEENYWSVELCFVHVPVKGQTKDMLHLIDETLAMRFLPSARIIRFRLALATKPYDAFFLCEIPSRNLDNEWNKTNLQACELAKVSWIQATSRRPENKEGYKIDHTKDSDPFPAPKWPKQSLNEIIARTFSGDLAITTENHPGLLRLIGAKITP